ncbi:MAG: glutamate formimidoyltransferase, partial [Anaerolineales bacterium]|nr:glutamate formimidoyltransferase [Anaerolineales bacterium]
MNSPLVECVPNFSDGRRPEVLKAIRDTISSVEGVYVMDIHSDADHNRSVITFVGHPQAVEEAAFRMIKKASELIDMENHMGEHPRIGATDVVPFVPISDITMAECVEMAHRLGERVGEKLKIPVFFYEEAALIPERKRLEIVRKGEYEGLKVEIGTVPDRNPDCGPAELGSAGATVIGAREFLIAFNVNLTTDDE